MASSYTSRGIPAGVAARRPARHAPAHIPIINMYRYFLLMNKVCSHFACGESAVDGGVQCAHHALPGSSCCFVEMI